MSKLMRLLLCLPLLLCQPVKAVFTYASKLSNGKQNIYFFNDIHEAYDKAPEQQIQLVSFAKRLNATLLTEEMTDMNTLRRYIHDDGLLASIQVDCMNHLAKEESDLFPLRGLSLFARSMGVNATNIDYRQWVDAFRTGRSITGKMAMHVLDTVIEEIKAYDDNPVFNAYYDKTIDMVTTVFKPLWDYLRVYDIPVADLAKTEEFKRIITEIHNDPRKKELGYSDYWIAYDADIFDCILLHKLAQSTQEHIIVCAGAFHCNLASDLLEQVGFTKPKEHECGQRALGTHPMHMPTFVDRILQNRMLLCIDQVERKEIINQALHAAIDESTKILEAPWLYGSVSSMDLFILVYFISVIGFTGLLTRQAYALNTGLSS